MNGAHLHLVLNHLPIFSIPLGLVFLLHSFYSGNQSTKRFAFLFMVLAGLSALPAFLTGEEAEEVIEHLVGVSKSLIHEHEEASEVALIFSLTLGVLAGLQLLFEMKSSDQKSSSVLIQMGRKAVVGVAILTSAILIYAANLGGKIRHPEIRESSAADSVSDYSRN